MLKKDTSIKWWLITVATMIFLMVFIGGVTRLTDSGLSMVDWKPIMGAIPPTSEAEWNDAFNAYKNFPEYKLVNHQMDLEGFKKIFFWEWFHRLFGRMIGLVFFFPFVFFLVRKKLTQTQIKKYSIAFILGGCQGLLGWYMVKSGLVNNPDVSHFRLAAHLSLAFLIIGYIYWLLLELKFKERNGKFLSYIPLIFLVLLSLQIVHGAFVAGMDAGLTHNTFPKMGRTWIPRDLLLLAPGYLNIFENPVMLQFIHRYLGIAVFVFGIFTWLKLRGLGNSNFKNTLNILPVVLLLQVILGVLTLIWYVPLWTASMHQLGACLLLLIALRVVYFNRQA